MTANFTTAPAQPLLWHTLPADEALQKLQSDRQTGLLSEQVIVRQHQHGPNELQTIDGRSAWAILIDQFKNAMLIMLITVALVSGGLDLLDLQRHTVAAGEIPFKDTVAILAIVLLNGILGYVQESRAEQALAALKTLTSPRVRVLRDSQIHEVEAPELVPGDVMLLEAGVQVAADGLLLEAVNLQVRESALTGESQAVTKQSNLVLPQNTAIGDRVNLIFQGTAIVQGRGVALVTSTGMKTELGRIATLLQTVNTEPTPLQVRMDQLSQALVTGSMVLVGLVMLAGVVASGSLSQLRELLEVSLSMAVAVVPEGLPAVITVTLALGTQRMVKRNALIRRLAAVETLGSVTTICSDKTGTLTQNKMVVQSVHTGSDSMSVTADGYSPVGVFFAHNAQLHWFGSTTESPAPPAHPEDNPATATAATPSGFSLAPELRALLIACVLCNDATLQLENGEWTVLGDPTEGALLALAAKAGLYKDDWLHQLPRVSEIPFSSERKRMSVICRGLRAAGLGARAAYQHPTSPHPASPHPTSPHPTNRLLHEALPSQSGLSAEGMGSHPADYALFCKGSPELVLDRCQWIFNGRIEPLTLEQRRSILEHNNQLAGRGLRVLGFAYKALAQLPTASPEEAIEQALIWLGLVDILDAPRPEAREAVARCQSAGIRPILITGDHQLTAEAVALDLGIARLGDAVLNGQALEQMTQMELEQAVDRIHIYARVAPEHKLRIVQALQRRNQIVGMTGDGVNDAPALKQSDIGIAMGLAGTDVSKEASDMVLLDDNFATIVAAVEEGRVVYTNIRRFIKYIMGSNIGEMITLAASPLLLPLGGVPLTPLQILWMNLVTDGLPALALAVEPAEPDVMKRPPHHPQESIFARGLGYYIVRIGVVLSIISIALMQWAYGFAAQSGDPERWKTMVFTTLCLTQMGHAMAIRSHTRLTLELNPLSNPFLLAAVGLTTLLQLLLIYVPSLREFFGTHYLSPLEVSICLGCSLLMFTWVELEKLLLRWQHRR